MFPQKLSTIILLSLSIINYHNHDEIGSLFPHGRTTLLCLGRAVLGFAPTGASVRRPMRLAKRSVASVGIQRMGKKNREKLGKMAIYWDFMVIYWDFIVSLW